MPYPVKPSPGACRLCLPNACDADREQLVGQLMSALDAVQVLCHCQPEIVSRFFTRLRNEKEPPVLPERATYALRELIREITEPPPPPPKRPRPSLKLLRNLR